MVSSDVFISSIAYVQGGISQQQYSSWKYLPGNALPENLEGLMSFHFSENCYVSELSSGENQSLPLPSSAFRGRKCVCVCTHVLVFKPLLMTSYFSHLHCDYVMNTQHFLSQEALNVSMVEKCSRAKSAPSRSSATLHGSQTGVLSIKLQSGQHLVLGHLVSSLHEGPQKRSTHGAGACTLRDWGGRGLVLTL